MGRQNGTRPFLIKPFNQTQLKQAIEAVTGSHSAVK
jgi:FixJ family two-component response regulator